MAISSRGIGARSRYDDYLTPEGEFRIASMQYTSNFPRQMLLETWAQALADYRAQYGDDLLDLFSLLQRSRYRGLGVPVVIRP